MIGCLFSGIVLFYRNLVGSQTGLGETICEEVFANQLGSHTGRAFEECAKQYMRRAQYMLFSKSGFTNALKNRATKNDRITLSDLRICFV